MKKIYDSYVSYVLQKMFMKNMQIVTILIKFLTTENSLIYIKKPKITQTIRIKLIKKF